MKISIVIPAYNAVRTIGAALDACRAVDWPDKEIIVVDDGSTDDTAGVVARFPEVMLVRRPNGGPAAARNSGWRAARGDVVFFTDSDCLPHGDVLQKIAPHFNRPETAGAGGTYGIANGHSLLARLIHMEIMWRHRNMGGDVDFLGSFNCAYRRSALERVGGFNEEYKNASGEDNDLSYRVLKSGYKLAFEKGAAVDHFHEESLTQYLARQYRHGMWRVKLLKEHRDMRTGDRYAGIADFIQPPLGLLLAVSLPSLLAPGVRPPWLAAAAIYASVVLWQSASIASALGKGEALLSFPLLLLRGVARGFGLARGVARFGL